MNFIKKNKWIIITIIIVLMIINDLFNIPTYHGLPMQNINIEFWKQFFTVFIFLISYLAIDQYSSQKNKHEIEITTNKADWADENVNFLYKNIETTNKVISEQANKLKVLCSNDSKIHNNSKTIIFCLEILLRNIKIINVYRDDLIKIKLAGYSTLPNNTLASICNSIRNLQIQADYIEEYFLELTPNNPYLESPLNSILSITTTIHKDITH